MSPAVDLKDPGWFPADLHVPNRQIGMLRVDAGVLERSTFLDTRIDAPLADVSWLPIDDVPRGAPAVPPGWLFHTSFCCSTLLARALDLSPARMVLREPLVLRRLGDARNGRWPVTGLVEPVVSLLARPWQDAGGVVVKPTHAALNVAPDLMAAAPGSRAVILTSGLLDFLVSNIKKTPETQAKIPELAERALNAGSFARRLGPAALAPPDLLAAAGLQWAAQRELCLDLFESAGRDRVRTLDAARLLAAPVATAVAAARWFGYGPDEDVATTAQRAAQRNAKATSVAYGPGQRAHEARLLRERHAPALEAAIAWVERYVAPSMRETARQLPEVAPLDA